MIVAISREESGSEWIAPDSIDPSNAVAAARGSSIGVPVVYVVISEETVTVRPIVYVCIAEAASSAKNRAVHVAAAG
jgi:hypothetical protein